MVLVQKLGVGRWWEDKLKEILALTTRSRLYSIVDGGVGWQKDV